MSSFNVAWIAALLILIGSALSQEQLLDEEQDERSPRFGFALIDSLRKSFCKNFCASPNNMSYGMNLACAIKCPELYLPDETTNSTSAMGSNSSMNMPSNSSMNMPPNPSMNMSSNSSMSGEMMNSTNNPSNADNPAST